MSIKPGYSTAMDDCENSWHSFHCPSDMTGNGCAYSCIDPWHVQTCPECGMED